ncbi:MAG: hypothetical protein QOI07_3254 [Verrucomicrobiota bacterium]|jgi:hypothetical protein
MRPKTKAPVPHQAQNRRSVLEIRFRHCLHIELSLRAPWFSYPVADSAFRRTLLMQNYYTSITAIVKAPGSAVLFKVDEECA